MKPYLLVLTLALTGCASADHYYAWQGHGVDELLLSWGAPSRSVTVPGNRRRMEFFGPYGCDISVNTEGNHITRMQLRNACLIPGAASEFPEPTP